MSSHRPTRQPVQWIKLDAYDPTDRFLDCPNYERCLDLAIHENWQGWTCRFCGINRARLRKLREEEQTNGQRKIE